MENGQFGLTGTSSRTTRIHNNNTPNTYTHTHAHTFYSAALPAGRSRLSAIWSAVSLRRLPVYHRQRDANLTHSPLPISTCTGTCADTLGQNSVRESQQVSNESRRKRLLQLSARQPWII